MIYEGSRWEVSLGPQVVSIDGKVYGRQHNIACLTRDDFGRRCFWIWRLRAPNCRVLDDQYCIAGEEISLEGRHAHP
jgi:hypothetical protein